MKYLMTLIMLLLTPVVALALAAVDLNSASVDQLESLPGVGKKVAENIVAARPFQSIEDLKAVKGIGNAKYNKIKDLVTVSGTATNAAPAPTAASSTTTTETQITKATTSKNKLAPGQVVNVNTATAQELARIPGIGPVKAEAIIKGRPYASVEDLKKVRGIKEGTLAKMRPYVTVR